MSNYDGEIDFLKWYKKNYGADYDNNVGLVKKDGMSDIDFRIGSELKGFYDLNNNYQQEKDTDLANRNNFFDEQANLLKSKYGTAVDSLNDNKRMAQQNASIGYDKLKKYLPTQIKSQGLGGLGVSESSMLQAYSKYNNDMGSIASNYNSNMANLESDKINQLSSLENYRQDSLNEINQRYTGYEQKTMEEAKNNVSKLLDNYLQEEQRKQEEYRKNAQTRVEVTLERLIGDGKYDEALKYIDNNKNIFDELTHKTLVGDIEAERQIAKENQQKEQEEYEKHVLAGEEYIESNGSRYKIKSQLSKDANEIKRNNDFKQQLKDKFGTTNPYDSKIPNGTTITVKADNKGANDFNFWDDVGAAIFSPLAGGAWDSWANWNTVNMTYYNGQWYKSEKG